MALEIPPAAAAPDRSITLADRYRKERGGVYLNGQQALVRLPIEQMRRDRAAGLHTRAFITGYPGSPLGGYDLLIKQAGSVIGEHGIVHRMAANEELAATSLLGTQMLDDYPHAEVDGVVGFWYGKGPGIDRAGDALKHGNMAGTSRHGAVVVLSGEDHEAKSSTMPFQQDFAFVSAGIPIVYPSTVQEFLTFGLHAIALSRFSGCWVAMKLVNPLCDGGEIVQFEPGAPAIRLPERFIADGRPFQKYTDFKFFPGTNIVTERHLYRSRHAAVRAYTRLNGLDRVVVSGPNDTLGIVTAGKSFADLRQALLDLGYDEAALRDAGVRILKLGCIYPADGEAIRTFARGLERVIVIEEKRAFVEDAVKLALSELEHRVVVIGKDDERGEPFFPLQGGFDADLVAERLAPRLAATPPARTALRLAEIASIRSRDYAKLARRTPNYCSGCPHNVSTVLPEGEIAWGSPGCHSFASVMEQPQRHIEAMTQYGGEGLPWIGLAPFTEKPHLFQNVGDGSLFHSSYLNIRYAVTTGVNITYKILFNGAVANTGAQAAIGGKTPAQLAALLALDGVRKVVIATKEAQTYRGAALPPAVSVRDWHDLDAVQRELAATPGCTVLIYDGTCANERRRREKRGTLPPDRTYVVINEDVCENCGHCGSLTNCMSLQKVDTPFGPKTQVHQSSCNHDRSCLDADCPSFVTVTTDAGGGLKKRRPPAIDALPPEPAIRARLPEPYHVYVPGTGGTGVLTLNAILCFAAAMDGKRVLSYDQTGAAQKWGPVLSSFVIAEHDQPLAANKVGLGKADLYLALDLMAAADAVNLDRCSPQRTVAVMNTSLLPSGEMIRDVRFSVEPLLMIDAIASFTDRSRNVLIDARTYAEDAFGDYMMTNFVALGAAYQAGLVPVTGESIEAAIRLNGVAVEANVAAFRLGRLAQHDRAAAKALLAAPETRLADRSDGAEARLSAAARAAVVRIVDGCGELGEATRAVVRRNVVDLIGFQDAAYAERYTRRIAAVAARERAALPAPAETIALAAARGLHKLMAYKDEYEVARLHTDARFRARATANFERPVRLSYTLHPPLLRALGMKRKLTLGPWFTPLLRALVPLRRLRGTPLDLFGYAELRRVERGLIGWYERVLDDALARLSPATAADVLAVAELPDDVRGYEDIKLGNVARVRARADELSQRLGARS